MADRDFSKLPPDEQQRVLNRILKIDTLRQSRNEGEAAVAAAKLTEQLTMFNLTMADLQRRGDTKKIPYGLYSYQYRKAKEIRSKWKQGLLGDLCHFNGLAAYTRGDTNYMRIIGEEHTFRVVTEIYETLVRKLTSICEMRWLVASRGQNWTPAQTIKFKSDWLVGARDGVWLKLKERDDYNRGQSGRDTMALVVYREEELKSAVDRIFGELEIKVRSAKKTERRHTDAYKDGTAVGYDHNFEKEVNA